MKNYARPGLNKQRLGELIDLIGTMGLGDKESRSKDVLGQVYEYFLGQFADAEGKKGGQFYTPRSIVKLLVEMPEPYKGRIFDPLHSDGRTVTLNSKTVSVTLGHIQALPLCNNGQFCIPVKLCWVVLYAKDRDSKAQS